MLIHAEALDDTAPNYISHVQHLFQESFLKISTLVDISCKKIYAKVQGRSACNFILF